MSYYNGKLSSLVSYISYSYNTILDNLLNFSSLVPFGKLHYSKVYTHTNTCWSAWEAQEHWLFGSLFLICCCLLSGLNLCGNCFYGLCRVVGKVQISHFLWWNCHQRKGFLVFPCGGCSYLCVCVCVCVCACVGGWVGVMYGCVGGWVWEGREGSQEKKR